MSIKKGDTIPSLTLRRFTADGMQEVTTDSIFSGRKVVLFGLPGAYTPTCQNDHLPSFLEQHDVDDAWHEGAEQLAERARAQG